MKDTVVHLFRLGVAVADAELFHEVGEHNLITSHQNEAGTLAMFSSLIQGSDHEAIVFEVYQNEKAYETHRQSPQFKNYVEKVGSKLTNRQAYEVTPVFLQEKLPEGQWVGSQHFYPKFAQVSVKEGAEAVFEASVLRNMETSLKEEDGVLAMYAMKDIEAPDTWYFYEIYASQAAYESHRQTAHFKNYLFETSDLLRDKVLLDLTNDVMVTKGEIAEKPSQV